MPFPSPFHDRMAQANTEYAWKIWGGFLAPAHYGPNHLVEYFAFRESAGVTDVTPLYKYDIIGPDAAAFLSRVMAKSVEKLKVGRMTYGCWCDPQGKIIDDGTVGRLDEEHYRLTAAEPMLWWLAKNQRGFDCSVEETTHEIGALAIQGPTSRDILKECTDADMDGLKFFGTTAAKMEGGIDIRISRTGYTGDLGYEVWCDAKDGVKVWDALFAAGRNYAIQPAGMEALDMARVEAGFIMAGVDFFSAPGVIIEPRKSTPFELGLDWTVKLDRGHFVGQKALKKEKAEGSKWKLVGLEASWEELEKMYERLGLPPGISPQASRAGLPVYLDGHQVGQVTSSTWSPIMKTFLGIASIRSEFYEEGLTYQLEHTIEYERKRVQAKDVPMPFFNPERKRKP